MFENYFYLNVATFFKSGMDIYCGHTTEVQTVHNEDTRCAWKVLGKFLSLIMLESSRGRRWEHLV